MTYSSYRVKVPGKLMIAGEYAVLGPNQPAVVTAVNRYLTAYIEPGRENLLSLPQLGLEAVTWETNDEHIQLNPSDSRLRFIQNTIQTVNQFLREKSIKLRPFRLTIKSDLDDQTTGQKYGLGSSAAIVVAVVSSMLSIYNVKNESPSLDYIFKLSAISHLKTQKNGSGADIAAAVYGGFLAYSSYKTEWIRDQLEQGEKLTGILELPWPQLSIRPLESPAQLTLAVGWTKEAISTTTMITMVEDYRLLHEEEYRQFLNESSQSVLNLIKSFETNDFTGAILSIKQNGEALRMLGERAGIPIETAKLKTLVTIADQFGGGKPSGAGGGDCGIAFLNGNAQIEKLHRAWTAAEISPLKISVSKIGVFVTEYNCEPSLEEWFAVS